MRGLFLSGLCLALEATSAFAVLTPWADQGSDASLREQLVPHNEPEKRAISTAYINLYTCLTDSIGGNLVLTYSAYKANASNTIDGCVQSCAAANFAVSGVRNGADCYCDSVVNYVVQDSGCAATCTGNSAQTCGDTNKITISQSSNVLGPRLTFVDAFNYRHRPLGCYSAPSGNNVFAAPVDGFSSSTTMTMRSCAAYCTGLGFMYSAGTGGNTCYCGKTLPAYSTYVGPLSGVANLNGCNTPCTGNSSAACVCLGRFWASTRN